MSLGTAWILGGLEITLAGSVAGVLSDHDTLRLSSAAVGAIATVYLLGEVLGALVFGRLSDSLGRRRLFIVRLGVYLVGSGLTAATSGPGRAGWCFGTRRGSSPAPASAGSTRRSTQPSMR
jgi:MFS family permease